MSYPDQISNPPSTNWAVQVNEALEAIDHQGVYAYRVSTSSGLTWGYHGGRWGGFSVAAGTHTLTNASDNYIVVQRSDGVPSVSTSNTNWNNTTSYARVYKLTTAGSVVTVIEDHRAGPSGVHGGSSSSAGTVTNTGGNLTSNAVVLGAGTVDTKVVAGITTDGTSALNLGVAGASVGKVVLANATSGSITIQPTTGALGTVTLTAPATTGTLALLSDIAAPTEQYTMDGTPASDDLYHGLSITGVNAGATIAQWEAVYLASDGEWALADANGSGTYPCRGMAAAAGTDGNPMTVVMQGVIRNDAWAWTVGGTIYLSTTAGGLTQTAPSGSGEFVQRIGFAISADVMYLAPSAEVIELD